MSPVVDSRRRWFGLLLLLLSVGMLIWGQTWLRPHLRGLGYVAYWLVCLVLTLMALITALLDARATRRRLREQQRELLTTALSDLASQPRPRRRRFFRKPR